MTHEEHHRMLADKVHYGHTRQTGSNEQSGQAAQDYRNICYGYYGIASKLVARHSVGSIVEEYVACDEQQYQQYGNAYCPIRLPPSDYTAPSTTEFEEEKPHRHVAKTHP